jgi:hypothetical protein
MRWWSSDARWVSDENGLRWYFSEPNPGGPSRLECYRRLLAEPDRPKRRRWADLLNLARLSWQDPSTIRPQLGQGNAG